MSRFRLILLSAAILLPALVITSVGFVLVFDNIPAAARREPRRVTLEYRALAEELDAYPERATSVGARQKGWRQVGRINGRAWGYVVAPDGQSDRALVWLQIDEGEWRTMEVERIEAFPFETVFYLGGLIVAVVLFWLSLVAVECFLRFTREHADFLAAVAHDLTTPLVAMKMMIGVDDDSARRLNARLLLIVENLLGFLRLGGKAALPKRERLELVALAREAARLFETEFREEASGEVGFDSSALKEGELFACGDEIRVLQILWNLLGNDLKYAAPYGRVFFRFCVKGKRAVVELADEGRGMTWTMRRRAFDRYYRARTVMESGKGGFGIGLCKAREDARAMGGELTVRRNRPQGVIFRLTLPVWSEYNTRKS